ncbi:MAG: GNAT family N-acetyltransferase [Candidatus Obscuribacterales bacterium]|nr:GNAT family N-acetyltransferase [Candidatus Obscuribacterales bacterium]
MKIRDLEFEDDAIKIQVAEMLFAGFSDMSPDAWPGIREAMEEVEESFSAGRISVVALENKRAVGWAAAIRQYNGNTWELHPLVVHQSHRTAGIGTALVTEIESRVNESGGLTLWVAADDESGKTSLFGQDLYPEPLEKLKNIRNTNGHPFEFYEKLGFTICGVLPDANGFGKPDIFMAKRVRRLK